MPNPAAVPTDGGGGATVTFPEPSGNGSAITNYQTSATPDGTEDYRNLPYDVSDDGQGNRTVTINVTGLENYPTSYTILVRAQNQYGYGPSGQTSVQPGIKPLAPRVIGATPGDTQAVITYAPAADNGSSPLVAYTVTSTPDGLTGYCDLSNPDDPCVADRQITVPGLTNGTEYSFTVTASNSNGQTSDPSAPSAGVIPFGLPFAPSLTVTGISYRSASIAFTPAADNGRPITTYQYSLTGGRTWGNFGNRRSGTIALAANARYQLAVRGVNLAGAGATSNVVSILTNPGALSTPSVSAGTSWALVSWRRSPNDGATLGYTVYAHPGPATCSTYYRADTSCLIGAHAGTRYTYTVVARNRTGGSPISRASRAVVAAAPRVPSKAPGVIRALSTGKVGKVKRGAKVKVAGAGFLPYSSVTVVAYGKKGHVTGRLVANGRGQIFATVRAPKDKIKKYTFVAFGVTQYGSSKAIGKTLRRK